MVSPVSILKNWHWSFSPNQRRNVILKFVALAFKASDLLTTNQERVRQIAAYAALIEVKVYESTESPSDYYRIVVEKFNIALKKIIERKRERLENERIASLQTNPTQVIPPQAPNQWVSSAPSSVIYQPPPYSSNSSSVLEELLRQPPSRDFGVLPSPLQSAPSFPQRSNVNVVNPPTTSSKTLGDSIPSGNTAEQQQQQQPFVSNGVIMQESDADFLRKCEICLKVKHELN